MSDPDSSYAYIYDDLDRVTSIDNDGTAETPHVVLSMEYDANGNRGTLSSSVDSTADLANAYLYDALNRLTRISQSGPGVASKRVDWTYDDNGRSSSITRYGDLDGTNEAATTSYTFDDAGRLTHLAHTHGPATISDFAWIYNAKGQLTSFTGPDGSTDYAYDDLSRVQTITSYDAASGGNVANQIKYTYDGWGNIIKSEQEHDGAVDQSTPSVQYVYADGAVSGEARYVRLSGVIYPDGREVRYDYGSTGDSPVLSRVEAITDSTGTVEYARYGYLGAGTIVSVSHPDVAGGLTLSYGDETDGYSGFDRFGRITNQQWRKDDETLVDGYSYTYDRAGNRTAKVNLLNSNFSETYAYDGLNRLIDTDRGGTDLQDWTLDSLGNWSAFTDDSGTQTRTANAANEITGVSGTWVDPVYDETGNMALAPKGGDETTPLHLTYDAWNRMMAVYADDDDQSGDLIASYGYDGANRRIGKTVNGQTEDHYYNESWQLLEMRVNGDADPREQYVYDIRYVDAPAVRFFDGNTDGDLADAVDNTLYATGDANFNITGLVDASTGEPVQRAIYTPYGQRTILTINWQPTTDSYSWLPGHQGLRHDAESGMIYNRARYLHTSLGVFAIRDFIGYADGMSLYVLMGMNPITYLDPTGLAKVPMGGDKWDLYLTNEHPTFISVEQARQLGVNVPQGSGDVDLGPHLHNYKTGDKFFPRYGVIRDKSGKLTPASNRTIKDWEVARANPKLKNALARAGIAGFLLMMSLTMNECTGENERIVSRIKHNLIKLQLNKPRAEKDLAIAIIVDDIGKLFGSALARNIVFTSLSDAIDNPLSPAEVEKEFDSVAID